MRTPPSPFQKSALYRQPLGTVLQRMTPLPFVFFLPCNGNKNLEDLKPGQCGTEKLLPKALPPALTTVQNSSAQPLPWVFSAATSPWKCSQLVGRSLKAHNPSLYNAQRSLSVWRLLCDSPHLAARHHAQVMALQRPLSRSSCPLLGLTLEGRTRLQRAPKCSMRAREVESPGAKFAVTKLKLLLLSEGLPCSGTIKKKSSSLTALTSE